MWKLLVILVVIKLYARIVIFKHFSLILTFNENQTNMTFTV